MQNNKMNNVDVNNTRRGKSKFNFDHDVNTTASLGTLQPICTQFMEANDKVSLSTNSLVRANAMVAPAWLKMVAKAWSCFVPLSSVFPNENYLMTRTAKQSSQGKFVPNSYPYISRAQLTALTLIGARYSIWVHDTTQDNNAWLKGTRGASSTSSDPAEVMSRTLYTVLNTPPSDSLGTGEVPSFNLANHDRMDISFMYRSVLGWVDQSADVSKAFVPAANTLAEGVFGNVDINPSTADIVCFFGNPADSASWLKNRMYAVCFKWSTAGSLFAKMLRGFGINLDIRAIDDKVSMLPLFAWYRAYFNFHGIERIRNWESTFCHRLIHEITEYNKADFMAGTGHLSVDEAWNQPNSPFWQFIAYELYQSFYPVDNYDYISGQRATMTEKKWDSTATDVVSNFTTSGYSTALDIAQRAINGSNANYGAQSTDGLENQNGSFDSSTPYYRLDTDVFSTGTIEGLKTSLMSVNSLNADAIEALKRLSRMTNKHDVLGQNVRALLRALGYGAYCDDSPVDFVGYREFNLDVSDVTATADTWNDVSGEGRVVGEQAGKSVTSSIQTDYGKPMTYEADERGYFITMFGVCPISGYVNMEDGHTTMLTADAQYQKEFDGLGYEASSKEDLFGDHPVAERSDNKKHIFGFAPRFTKLKVKSNILNGDFKRGSTRSAMLPYSGDKIVRYRDVGTSAPEKMPSSEAYAISFSSASTAYSTIPVAGESWAYNYRYGFLGQLNRAFVTFNEGIEGRTLNKYLPLNYDEWTFTQDDNLIIHTRNNMTLYSEMLPVANSYRTADDEAPANDTMDIS